SSVFSSVRVGLGQAVSLGRVCAGRTTVSPIRCRDGLTQVSTVRAATLPGAGLRWRLRRPADPRHLPARALTESLLTKDSGDEAGREFDHVIGVVRGIRPHIRVSGRRRGQAVARVVLHVVTRLAVFHRQALAAGPAAVGLLLFPDSLLVILAGAPFGLLAILP